MRKFFSILLSITLITCTINSSPENKDFFRALYEVLFPDTNTITGEDYLNRLMHDLRHLPYDNRHAIGEAFTKQIGRYDRVSIDQAHAVAESVIVLHGEQQARIVAQAFFHNTTIVAKNIKSQNENIRAALQKQRTSKGFDYHINSSALAPYFGQQLFERLEKIAHHPEYEQYLKPEWQTHVQSLPSYYKPAPKPAPVSIHDYQRICDQHEQDLKRAGMLESEISTYKKLFWNCCYWNSCENNINATHADIICCSKMQIKSVLLNNLAKKEEELRRTTQETNASIKAAVGKIERDIEKDIPSNGAPLHETLVSKYTGRNLDNRIIDAIVDHSA